MDETTTSVTDEEIRTIGGPGSRAETQMDPDTEDADTDATDTDATDTDTDATDAGDTDTTDA